MRHTNAQTVAPPPGNDPPASLDPAFRAIEGRVELLLRRGGTAAANALLDAFQTDTAYSRFPAHDRARILLFAAIGLLAVRSRRISREAFLGLTREELAGSAGMAEHRRLIQRHGDLLLRLVVRGCERRGEIPHRSSYKKPSHRKGAADANA